MYDINLHGPLRQVPFLLNTGGSRGLQKGDTVQSHSGSGTVRITLLSSKFKCTYWALSVCQVLL